MPYTPPSISPSGLHSVSPLKSSSSYAGLANGYTSPSTAKQYPPPAPPPSRNNSTSSHHHTHAHHHARPTTHHRRSSGPTSPQRGPIPVTAFAQDRPAPRRPSPVRRTSSDTNSSSSDEDEDLEPQHHSLNKRNLSNLKELRDAIRENLPQHKAASPPGSPDQRYLNKTVISAADNLPPLVTDNIRYDSTTSDGEHSSSTTPPDDGIDFPRMVRKKSGEVVRPSLKNASLRRRPLSLPSTPVFPKAVHFDAQLEHVRHFLHSEKPLAVSTNTSPSGEYSSAKQFPFEKELSEKQYQIELPNFPTGDQSNRRDNPVRVDSVFLSSNGRNLIGKVLVRNIAFHKWVAVRFTFDHWQTVSEISANYDDNQNSGTPSKEPGWDRFTFNIKLEDFPNLESRHMLFCVRYNVADQEFWDNNYGSNYQVEFRKRPNYLLRRSTHPPEISGLPRRVSDDSAIGDDFDIDILPETFAKNLADQISSPRSALLANLGESLPFVQKATLSSTPSTSSDIVNGTPQKRPTGKVFANRYDFSASLSAAIANANMTMGPERSGLGQKTETPKVSSAPDSYFAPLPLLFRDSPPVQSPIDLVKEDSLVNNIKKSHLSGLQQSHHFRSRSYPMGSPSQSPGWQEHKEGYNSDDSSDKPPIDSNSYLDFISNYCFVQTPPAPQSLTL